MPQLIVVFLDVVPLTHIGVQNLLMVMFLSVVNHVT